MALQIRCEMLSLDSKETPLYMKKKKYYEKLKKIHVSNRF